MLIVTQHPRLGLVVAEPGVGDRLAVRLRSHALDSALAAGAEPESDLRLAIRAHDLTQPESRRILARSLERILTEATRRAGLRPTTLSPGSRRTVREAATDLDALIARLRGHGPVAARGVALVAVLIGDGAGPLHTGARDRNLRAAVRQALQHLDDPLTGTASPET